MERVLWSDITVADAVFFGSSLLAGLLAALVTRIVTRFVKRRLRGRVRTSLPARIVDDADGPVALWLVLTGIYIGLLRLPPLSDHLDAARQGYTVASIVVVVFAVIRLQGSFLRAYGRRVGRRTGQTKVWNSLLPMVQRILAIVLLAIGALTILDQLGVSIAPLIAGLGVTGLAVALALQGTLTNFFAGLNVLTDGSIRVGDFIELEGGLRGVVDQIGWRTTRIRMLADNMVVIPNSRLADNITTNYNYPADEMSVYVEMGVGYGTDLDQVERVTVEVATQVLRQTKGSVEGYQPSVWYTEFGDSNINFWVVLRSHGYLDSWLVKHNFIKAVRRRYREENIEISFPARTVYMREEEEAPQPVGERPQAQARGRTRRATTARTRRQPPPSSTPPEGPPEGLPDGPGGGDGGP